MQQFPDHGSTWSTGPFLETSRRGRLGWFLFAVAAVGLIVGLGTHGSTHAGKRNSHRVQPVPEAPQPAAPASAPLQALTGSPHFRVAGTLPDGWRAESEWVLSNADGTATVMVTTVDWETPAKLLAEDAERVKQYGWTMTRPVRSRAMGRSATMATVTRSGLPQTTWYVPDGTGGTLLVSTFGESAEARQVVDVLRMRD